MILKTKVREVLENNILRFWENYTLDQEHGGFVGRVDDDHVIHPKADKAVILNTRLLWTYASAYLNLGSTKYRLLADRAYTYLSDYFFDKEHGGLYWCVNYQGAPVETKKQVYAQAFGIYGLSEYAKINQNNRALRRAIELFELLEERAYDHQLGGYMEAFSQEWGPIADVRLSEKDLQADKTMNTHLHVLEAYSNLYSVWPNHDLKTSLERLIHLMIDRFVTNTHHFHLFYDQRWRLLSQEISYGHDIEGSWLIYEAAKRLPNAELFDQVADLTVAMAKASMEGLDEDGGLMNESGPDGLDTDKHWWPQAEALVGLINAWQISGEASFLDQAEQVWSFIHTRIIDKAGEWHWRVDREGHVIKGEDKAGPWKCPYHNGRAMIELLNRL